MSSEDDDNDRNRTLLSDDVIDEIMQAIRPGETPNVSLLEPILRRFRNAPRTLDIVAAFDDMCLPEPLVAKLQPLFDPYGLEIKVAFVQDPYNLRKARSYTVATGPDYSLVVLHLKPWVMKISDGIAFLIQSTTNLRDHHLRILSAEIETPAFGYVSQLTAVSERQTGQWSFVSWGLVQQALHGQIKLEHALGFDPVRLKGSVRAEGWSPAAILDLDFEDRKAIVGLIVKELTDDTTFLAGLIKKGVFPEPLHTKAMGRLNGGLDYQVREVIDALSNWGAEPLGKSREHTCLGRFLICCKDSVGAEDQKLIQDIIVRYRLIKPGAA